jgi:uncharacterized protein YukE
MQANHEMAVDTVKLRAAAKVANSQMSIILSCFDNIKEEALSLKGRFWESDSAEAYVDSINKLCSDRKYEDAITTGSVIQTLKNYVIRLNNAADEYESNERGIEARIEALPGNNIFNV